MKSVTLFIVFLLAGCSTMATHEYTTPGGHTFTQTNAAIVMPFSPTSAHIIIENQEGEIVAEKMVEQDGWVPYTGSTLGSAHLIGEGLENSGDNVNSSTTSNNVTNVDVDAGKKKKRW